MFPNARTIVHIQLQFALFQPTPHLTSNTTLNLPGSAVSWSRKSRSIASPLSPDANLTRYLQTKVAVTSRIWVRARFLPTHILRPVRDEISEIQKLWFWIRSSEIGFEVGQCECKGRTYQLQTVRKRVGLWWVPGGYTSVRGWKSGDLRKHFHLEIPDVSAKAIGSFKEHWNRWAWLSSERKSVREREKRKELVV